MRKGGCSHGPPVVCEHHTGQRPIRIPKTTPGTAIISHLVVRKPRQSIIGSCYTRSQRCLQSQGGPAGLQSPASARETAPPLCGMCPHIQDEAWNPQCFRRPRECHIPSCLQKLIPAAHLLQRSIRVAQPGARRGVGGVAVGQHLLLCRNKPSSTVCTHGTSSFRIICG